MSDFGVQLEKFKKQAREDFWEGMLDVEDYVYNQLVVKSPVDSGAYHANHNRTLGAPSYVFVESKTSASEPQPLPRGSFINMFIANGAPYGAKIETGKHSDKAPNGVYKLAHNSARQKYGL